MKREYGQCPECNEKDLVTNIGNSFICNVCGDSSWEEKEW